VEEPHSSSFSSFSLSVGFILSLSLTLWFLRLSDLATIITRRFSVLKCRGQFGKGAYLE